MRCLVLSASISLRPSPQSHLLPDTAMTRPLLSFTLVSLLPQTLALGFMTGTISRYSGGQAPMLWEVCVTGSGSPGLAVCAWEKWF